MFKLTFYNLDIEKEFWLYEIIDQIFGDPKTEAIIDILFIAGPVHGGGDGRSGGGGGGDDKSDGTGTGNTKGRVDTTTTLIIVVVVAITILIISIATIVFVCYKRSHRNERDTPSFHAPTCRGAMDNTYAEMEQFKGSKP